MDGVCVLPHHNTFGKTWVGRLRSLLPDIVLLGIDEETGVVCSKSEGIGRVLGKGQITIYHNDLSKAVRAGSWHQFLKRGLQKRQGPDEYQLMVGHFSDAVLKKTGLNYSPDDSIANLRVLDALSEAARTGNTVSSRPDQLNSYKFITGN